MNIEIDCSKVAVCGNNLLTYVENFEAEIVKFNANIESINNIWDGADALKYVNTMKDECLTQLNTVKKVFEQYGEYLQKVSKPYEVLDESFASKTIEV